MPTAKQIQEQRAPIGAEIRKMADKINADGRDFTAEERAAWDKANADFDRLTQQIDVARRAEEVGSTLAAKIESRERPGNEDTDLPAKRSKGEKGEREIRGEAVEEVRTIALQAWCRRQAGRELTDVQKRACKLAGLNPGQRELRIGLPRRPGVEERALTATTGSSGAYTIPQGFVTNLEKALLAYNGVRQVADVMRTDSGNTIPWPTANDTGNTGELIAESTEVAAADPTFGVVNFGAYKFSSKMILVPYELLEDSAFNLAEELSAMLGERLGRITESYYTTGTNSSQPQGVVAGSTLGKTAASATVIAPDEIIDLIHSVGVSYRSDPSFRLMFHDGILQVIRKMKDGNGRYLFEEGQNGAPDRIKGVQFVINQNMQSTVATGTKTMLAGAFRKFKIRDVNTIRLRRFDERYGEKDQVGFVAFMRSDSKLLDAGTHPIKHLIQA